MFTLYSSGSKFTINGCIDVLFLTSLVFSADHGNRVATVFIDFQLGYATRMHIQRMLNTALDKIARVNNARIEEASIAETFSVLQTNIPTVDLLPYQTVRLQVDLQRFAKDGNTSFLYFTGMFLDAQTFFPGGVHGLNFY